MVQAGPEAGENVASFLESARSRLRDVFGFPSFREGQERALAAVAAGRDVLVIMPTGSGKSLCYQVPALVLRGVTLVVSPLIALMKDQVDALALRGVPVTFINSSLTAEEQGERLRKLEGGHYSLVYVAPERFRSRGFRSALSRVKVTLLAIDEAHCISEWGHDFRPDYRRLQEVRRAIGPVPTVALTATATPAVQEDIVRELGMDSPERVVTGFHRPNLALRVLRVRGDAQKRERLEEFIGEAWKRSAEGEPPAGIIYTGTRRHAEDVAEFLNSRQWPALSTGQSLSTGERPAQAYHAGLEAQERRRVQEDFMEGRLPWVAATNAFGMGVDKSDTRFVVHYDLPGSIEAYYQEVGRAGRDGEPAECLLLFSEADRHLQEFFIEGSNPDRKTLEAVHRFLHGLGENPLFRSLADLEREFASSTIASTRNPLAFRSSISILERGGALERLEQDTNLAEVSPRRPLPWPESPYPARAAVKLALHAALARVFEGNGAEPARISLERWAEELNLSEDSLRRGLSQLQEDGLIAYLPPFRGNAIRLPPVRLPLEQLGIDFTALEERKRRDQERLEQVLHFARARTCRRDIVLRHFGEELPREGCGRCDACRAEPPRELEAEEWTIVRKLLSGVARARGRCGQRTVIQMLRGSRTEAVAALGLDQLSTYGLLRDLRRGDLRDLFEGLEVAGCLRREGWPWPVVRLTDMGLRVMKDEERPALPLPRLAAPRPSAPARAQGSSREAPGDGEEGFDAAVFERLRSLRREIAEGLGLPAFRVFHDRTLKAMARSLPRDRESLLQIPGVGQVTLERFGGRFLEAIREACGAVPQTPSAPAGGAPAAHRPR